MTSVFFWYLLNEILVVKRQTKIKKVETTKNSKLLLKILNCEHATSEKKKKN